jgi:hypothetical protein
VLGLLGSTVHARHSDEQSRCEDFTESSHLNHFPATSRSVRRSQLCGGERPVLAQERCGERSESKAIQLDQLRDKAIRGIGEWQEAATAGTEDTS